MCSIVATIKQMPTLTNDPQLNERLTTATRLLTTTNRLLATATALLAIIAFILLAKFFPNVARVVEIVWVGGLGLWIVHFSVMEIGRHFLRRRLAPLIERSNALWREAEQQFVKEHPGKGRMVTISLSPQYKEWETVNREIIQIKLRSLFSRKG